MRDHEGKQTMFTILSKEHPARRGWAVSRIFRSYGLVILIACAVAIGLLPQAATAKAGKDYRLSGPYTQNNLAVYLIHRERRSVGPAPLTLGEAMKRGLVKVVETGSVSRLMVRNLGDREVFIQSGDIVKGGKQDRVLVASMIIPRTRATSPSAPFASRRDDGPGAAWRI